MPLAVRQMYALCWSVDKDIHTHGRQLLRLPLTAPDGLDAEVRVQNKHPLRLLCAVLTAVPDL